MSSMMNNAGLMVRPATAVASMTAYHVPRPTIACEIDLFLDANEGTAPPVALEALVAVDGPERMRRYPSKAYLEGLIAQHLGVAPQQVLVTAGGDDALDRCCRAVLEAGRNIVLPVPTFEMIGRSARLAGAEIREVEWPGGAYPTKDVMERVDDATGAVSVVSPNNPTGAVATAGDLRRLAAAAPETLLMVDLAYEEFADEPLTGPALRLPNAVVVRTFSKAFGLAGMRVGYAVGPVEIIDWLRAVGSPYPTSGLSLAAAEHCLSVGERDVCFLRQVKREREALRTLLMRQGVDALPSQANFVLARFEDAPGIQHALAERGIMVRAFPGVRRLQDCLRITCPGRLEAFDRLTAALTEILSD